MSSIMEIPLVSVITPVFNGEDYIEEVLAAVNSQTWENFEHIVVNDGSTDRTGAIVASFADRNPTVRYVEQQNSGEAAAVNRGHAECRGEFIVIVNADDPPYPRLIERTMRVMAMSPDVTVVYPDWDLIDGDGAIRMSVETLEYDQQALIGDFVCIPGPGALIRKEHVADGELRRATFRYVTDYDLWLRLSLAGPMKRCPEVLATWRDHASGTSSVAAGQKIAREYVQVIDDFFEQHEVPSRVMAWKDQAKAMSRYHASLQCIHSADVPGRSLMLRSLLTPFRRGRRYGTRRRHVVAIVGVIALGSRFDILVHVDQRIKRAIRNRRSA
jgi:glycosyltransferase involved in cell wall biosynthesis